MFPARLYPAPRHLPKLGKAHRVASSVDHGEESKTIMFFDFVGLLKFNSYFTSVDGTSDNGSLPVSGKVVPQAPNEEVCRFCHRQNLPNQSRGGWARVKPKVATPESII